MNKYVTMIALQLGLIALNAIFACAEIAVISMNDNKMDKMAEEGDKRAERLVKLTSQPARFLATIQVAITLSGFLGSAFAAENFSDGLVEWLIGLGVKAPVSTLDAISVVVITLILSYLTLIFGELVPKRVAMRNAEKLALGISGLINGISVMFAPIVWLLTASTNGVLRLIGIDPNAEEENVSEEEIRMMVDVGSEKGTIDPEEKQLIQNVFEFDDLTASEIATHRTELVVLFMEDSMDVWEEVIFENRHTFYPVCEDSVDNVVGILNSKDYFRQRDKSRENILKTSIRPAYFVPESVKADVLFKNMKHNRSNIAIVLDEYSGVSGMVTINDLVEKLVGDIEVDEPQEEEKPLIEQVDEKTWKVHGSVSLEELSETMDVKIEPTEDYETFNGLVFDALGAIPGDGETPEVETELLSIQVVTIQDHLVEEAIVVKKELPEEEEEE